ncbi:MAG: hypothetical protein QM764_05675 [Chitinophagaceae bacterium]
MVLKIFLICFFLYILYRFVFNFLLPVYKTTQKLKKGFRDMHEKVNEANNNQQKATQQPQPEQKKEQLGEYIDFEDIK